MKFKLSPLWLFLLLLIVLIISAIFIKPYKTVTEESFTSFYGTTNPNTTGLKIPTYDNPVDKLYDNDFFDPKTGNVLRVYAKEYDPAVGQDTTGSTIDHVDLIDRTGHTTTYNNKEKIIINGLTSVPYNYTSWTAFASDDKSVYVLSNQLIYSCWGQDTYIHIIDFTNNLNACGYYYSPGLQSPIFTHFNMSMPRLQVTKKDNDTNNNSYIFNRLVNMTLYQFTSSIFYSPLTGDLMVLDTNGKYLLYNRFGNSISKFTDTGIDNSNKPWVEYDLVGNHMILYVPYKTNTLIIVLKLNPDSATFSIITVGRFLADGSLQKDNNTNITIPPDVLITNQPNAVVASPISSNTKFAGTYNQQPGYNTMDSNFSMQQMNDYLLKTQIIPPICPACPVCPASGTCANCGSPSAADSSHRAFYTSSPAGISDFLKDTGRGVKDFAEDTGRGVKDFVEDTASGAANLAKETAGGAVGLAKETVGGAVDLAKETAGGAVGLAKETVGGAVGLAKETAGGAVDLAKETTGGAVGLAKEAAGGAVDIIHDIGSGIAGAFDGENKLPHPEEKPAETHAPAPVGYDFAGAVSGPVGYYAQGVSGPQNPFTYNGALTEKPSSNFIPLTADFSKFGR